MFPVVRMSWARKRIRIVGLIGRRAGRRVWSGVHRMLLAYGGPQSKLGLTSPSLTG